MSEKVSIQESGKTRNFNGVGVIETETPEGNSCFWVPESERELETEYVIKNGTYRPQKYGFSDIHVNVFDLTTDLDGINWKIDIGDIKMPDISLPDFDMDLTIGLDGMPNIDFGIRIITVDDDEIKVVLPGGEEMIIHGPSLTDPVVILDAIEISFDPSTGEWTVTALVDCTVGDTTYNPGDIIKTWPGTEKVDFYIQAGIALPDLSETIDLDAGFDVSLDVDDASGLDDIGIDISGSDLDGLPIDVNIDLDTLDIETTDLPDEIRIMHVPDKTSYKDGEEIDLEGIVVQAYRGGEVWTSSQYSGGYIPAHELILSGKEASNRSKISSADLQWENDKLALTSYETYRGVNQVREYDWYSILNGKMRLCFYEVEGDEEYTYDNGLVALIASLKLKDEKEFGEIQSNATGWLKEHFVLDHPIGSQYKENTYGVFSREHTSTKDGHFWGHASEDYDAGVCWHAFFVAPRNSAASYKTSFPINKGLLNITNRYITAPNGETIFWAAYLAYIMHYDINGNTVDKVVISWPRPNDGILLSTSFNITKKDGDTESNAGGQWGGTTISGNYGGSHHSGKF